MPDEKEIDYSRLYQYVYKNGEWTGVLDPVKTKHVYLDRVYRQFNDLVNEFVEDFKQDSKNNTTESFAIDLRDLLDIPALSEGTDKDYISDMKQEKWDYFTAYVAVTGIDYQYIAQSLMKHYRKGIRLRNSPEEVNIYLEYSTKDELYGGEMLHMVEPFMVVNITADFYKPDGTESFNPFQIDVNFGRAIEPFQKKETLTHTTTISG